MTAATAERSSHARTKATRKAPAQAPSGPSAARNVGHAGKRVASSRDLPIVYQPAKGVDEFVGRLAKATPMQLVDVERQGVHGRFMKDLSTRTGIPAVRLFGMLGIPKATVEKKAAAGEAIAGSGGQAAVAMAKLIAKAQEMVANSTAPEAKGFDAARWLGQWLERPQPALGGRAPSELIGTPTGAQVVTRLLGAIESGAYQ